MTDPEKTRIYLDDKSPRVLASDSWQDGDCVCVCLSPVLVSMSLRV